jgi:tetratricopeptide (TPR) repeat protein
MQSLYKSYSAYTLILLGSVIAFLGVFFIYIQPTVYFEKHVPLKLWGESDFVLGQYYFNHDDSPEGPYDLKKAQFFYERAIAKSPRENPILWYQSGRVDFIEGRFDQALLKFGKQIEFFGDEIPNVYYMTGLTYAYRARASGSEEDWLKAEVDFKKAVDFFYEAPWPYVDLAWVYFSQGKFSQMLPVLEKALSLESNNPWLLNMYGLALLNTGDVALAHEYFVFAQEEAGKLTVQDWGKSYPGNNPSDWGRGLAEFRSLIAKNVTLTEK